MYSIKELLGRIKFAAIRAKNRIWRSDEYPQLREFIYMDEDAVVSLLSSTTGGITEQRTTGTKKRISSSITATIGSGNASAGSKLGGSVEKSQNIVRRYVIQSNFKELYDIRSSDIVLSDGEAETGGNNPIVSLGDETPSHISGASDEIPNLERGSLVELSVSLESAQIYDYYRIIQAIGDIFETAEGINEFKKELQNEDVSTEHIRVITGLMEIFMADLVPLIGEVSNYAVTKQEDSLIKITEAEEENIPYDPLYVTGFINESNLWKDATRFLFDQNEFLVFGRIKSPQVTDEWQPMKMLDVVDAVLPELSDGFHEFSEALEDIDQEFPGDSPEESIVSTKISDDIDRYIEILDAEFELDVDDEIKSDIIEEIRPTEARVGIKKRREILKQAERALENHGYELELTEESRAAKLSEMWTPETEIEPETLTTTSEGKHMELNFISIYW